MKLFLVTALVLVPTAVLAGTDSIDKSIMEMVDIFNLYSHCWGEEAMNEYLLTCKEHVKECEEQYATDGDAVVASRRRRREVTDEHVEQLLSKFAQFKSMKKTNMDTLVCVLQKHKILDAEGNVDIESVVSQYTNSNKTNAGSDPAFMEKLTTGFRDCYDVSESWPQTMLDRHPHLQKYGRQHIFVMCMKKMEEKHCYEYRVKTMLDGLYGNMDNVDHAAFGFPADTYDAAYLSVKAKSATKSEASKFVDEILMSRAQFL